LAGNCGVSEKIISKICYDSLTKFMKKDRKEEGVHLIYKKIGETPKEAIERFKMENPEYSLSPMTYAGRLDPMAEGLLLVLSGQKLLEKEKYLSLDKKYEFEVLWGFETDTGDVLGLQVKSEKFKVKSQTPNEIQINEYIKKSVRKFEQIYPIYSSRPVGGKPLFQWAREGKISDVIVPKHEVEIKEVKFLERKNLSRDDLLRHILSKIDLIKGDFRQDEIKKSWQTTMSKMPFDMVVLDSISVKVSRGFYVRQFVIDMAKNLKFTATTLNILRTNIGDYSI
jgi:tRNA pseudouridine(55) synthase